MSDMGTESLGGLESALGAAFGDAPETPVQPQAKQPAKTPAKPQPTKLVQPLEPEVEEAPEAPAEDPADLLEGEEAVEVPEEQEASEPSYEIEIDGKPEVVTGSDRVKELLQRGLKAGRGFEENARVREALAIHGQQMQMQQQFQQAVSQDIAQLQAIDHALQTQFGKIDWQKEFSEDPFNAMRLKEQRDQLREQRAAAINDLNAKQQQFQAQFKENSQKVLAAENEALLAKVPAWRNPEKAKAEQGEIRNALTSFYNFTAQEADSVMDHRMILVARDAAAYRKLLANKDARVKQARQAPAIAKPGASAQPDNGRTEFHKARGLIKAHGAKGNHKAQEDIAIAMLNRAFK